jgi:ribosomal protein S14
VEQLKMDIITPEPEYEYPQFQHVRNDCPKCGRKVEDIRLSYVQAEEEGQDPIYESTPNPPGMSGMQQRQVGWKKRPAKPERIHHTCPCGYSRTSLTKDKDSNPSIYK